jgi:predicted DNA-binding transcriptional regulator YafY
LVQLLSGPARRTLNDLARELSASPRTIYRDLADLEARVVAMNPDLERQPARSPVSLSIIPRLP